jgi:hypothetical protein
VTSCHCPKEDRPVHCAAWLTSASR